MSDKNNADKLSGLLDKIPFLKKLNTIKHIEIIIFAIFILLAIIIMFSGDLNFTSNSGITETSSNKSYYYFSTIDYIKKSEENLKKMILSLDEVNEAEVMLSVSSGGEIVYATNSEEKTTTDKNSSTTIKTNEVVFVTEDGVTYPLVLKEILPTIDGVVIISKDVSDISVKLKVIEMVQNILDIPNNKINIYC